MYNQGNNHQKIFFDKRNYEFFLNKLETYVRPYADILAYCLMPNHFHFMVLVNELEVEVASASKGFASSETFAKPSPEVEVASARKGFAPSETFAKPSPRKRTLNQSIGIMLRSYTSAINKQEKRSGALFRQSTKAQCVTCPAKEIPNFYMIDGITTSYNIPIEKQYPQICFDYIHKNPVKAGLVKSMEDWKFSSAAAYFNKKENGIVNMDRALEYGLIK